MAYELEGRVSVSLFFNDEEFPFDRVNSLDFLHMSSSTKIGVPMFHLALQDNADFLSEAKHLAEGSRVQILIAAGLSTYSTRYAFRLNVSKRTPYAGGYRYEMDGYLDVPTYWHSSSVQGKTGTSFAVLREIANDCGLQFSGDQTTDSQLWLPRNIRYHEWARQISERGYRNDGSFMQLGLCFDKTLVYRDLCSELTTSASYVLAEYREGFLTATDVVPSTNSGTMNHVSGYADTLVEQDTESTAQRAHSTMSVNKKSSEGSLNMNAQVKSAVKQARVRMAPLDAGNVHPEYERALYQNRRMNNLFNVKLDLLSQTPTKLRLMEKVSMSMDNAQSYLKTYSGEYIIAGKTIYIQGADYYEKFEIMRRTLNSTLKDSVG